MTSGPPSPSRNHRENTRDRDSFGPGRSRDQYVDVLCQRIGVARDSFAFHTISNLGREYDLSPSLLKHVVTSYNHTTTRLRLGGRVHALAAGLCVMRVACLGVVSES